MLFQELAVILDVYGSLQICAMPLMGFPSAALVPASLLSAEDPDRNISDGLFDSHAAGLAAMERSTSSSPLTLTTAWDVLTLPGTAW